MKAINWDAVPTLAPVTFSHHCDHHLDLIEARKLIEKRESEIARLEAELAARFDLLVALVHKSGGRIVLNYAEFGQSSPDELVVFGWQGDWFVIQDHKYTPEDARHLPDRADPS